MERPRQDPPLDLLDFEAPVDLEVWGNRSGSMHEIGESTTAVVVVFGPDRKEVEAAQEGLSEAATRLNLGDDSRAASPTD